MEFTVSNYKFLSMIYKTQAAWEADKAEEERKLENMRDQLERSKSTMLSEQRDQMELLYKERKDIAREKSRLATASQKATEKVAKGEKMVKYSVHSHLSALFGIMSLNRILHLLSLGILTLSFYIHLCMAMRKKLFLYQRLDPIRRHLWLCQPPKNHGNKLSFYRFVLSFCLLTRNPRK